jgi:hypothetical protein
MDSIREPERWDVYDRYGNKIYMTGERWQHILHSRPWLAEYRDEILHTLRKGRRKQDTLAPYKYKYYWPCSRLLPEFNYLVAVVVFGETLDSQGRVIANNYVVTAWAVFIYGNR